MIFITEKWKLRISILTIQQTILFVQISDCVVGLLGKFYTYLNNLNTLQAQNMFANISNKQIDTLRLFARVFIKSEQKSKLLFHSIASIEEHDICSYIIRNALLRWFFVRKHPLVLYLKSPVVICPPRFGQRQAIRFFVLKILFPRKIPE